MNKTGITHPMEAQALISPAQDILGVCAELAAFSGHVTTEQWDTLRRVIATPARCGGVDHAPVQS